MEENDILKRIEKLERDAHPPVSWRKRIENIIDRMDHLYSLYAEVINSLIKQRK